jgi:hypothetical protein
MDSFRSIGSWDASKDGSSPNRVGRNSRLRALNPLDF